jgi:lipoprotein NlpI
MEFLIAQLLNGLVYGVLLFLMAAGLSLIFGLMNVVSLAHGSFFMLGAFVGLSIFRLTGSFWLALLLAPVPVAVLGIVMELLFMRPLYRRGHMDQVLLTFGFNRGETYRAKGDLDRAIVEYSEAMRLDGKDPDPLIARGIVYRVKGDSDRAIADLNEAIRLSPKSEGAYFNRGMAYLYSGALAQALSDVGQAADLDPKDAYNALWADIIAQRSKAPSRLSQAVARIDMNAWPAPIVRMFLGELTPAATLAAAGDPDPRKQRDHACEANFYGGQWALRQTKRDSKKEAARLFQLAANDCPPSFNEWSAAKAELKALGAVR